MAMDRIARLRKSLETAGVDALCVRDTSNIAYLTGFEGVFDHEQAHALLVDTSRALLHTDSRYAHACQTAACGSPVEVDDEACSHAAWLANRFEGASLGIEDSIRLAEFRKLEETLSSRDLRLVETSGLVARMRQVKDAAELERLRAAQAITDAAFAHAAAVASVGMTERELARELDEFMFAQGAEGLAFPTIVACGPNGANPHAQPGDARLEAGQCVVMDFGACAQGYCSDMTRMLFIGSPSARLEKAYSALCEANERVQGMLRPGVTGAEAHQVALDVLEHAGFGGLMGHGLGHGVGMVVHEEPVLAPRNKEALVAGNVVTVEPGIYVAGEFGMRLEDFGVVTQDGFEAFTRSSHEMVVVEAH